MMKNLILLILCLALGMPAFSQSRNTDDSRFTLQILNKRGKPIKNPSVIAYISGQEENALFPDDRGIASWDGVTEKDTLYRIMDKNLYNIYIGNMEEMTLVINNKKLHTRNQTTGETHSLGYVDVLDQTNTLPITTVRRNELANYRDLADYLDGRVAGLQVERSGSSVSVIIRGKNSINGDSKAIAVVDGTEMDFNIANQTINPNDVESVTILKDGSMYGVRGMNGVIVIKTRTE